MSTSITNDDRYEALKSMILGEGRAQDVSFTKDVEEQYEYFNVTITMRAGEPYPSFVARSAGHPYPALSQLAQDYKEWLEKPKSDRNGVRAKVLWPEIAWFREDYLTA